MYDFTQIIDGMHILLYGGASFACVLSKTLCRAFQYRAWMLVQRTWKVCTLLTIQWHLLVISLNRCWVASVVQVVINLLYQTVSQTQTQMDKKRRRIQPQWSRMMKLSTSHPSSYSSWSVLSRWLVGRAFILIVVVSHTFLMLLPTDI